MLHHYAIIMLNAMNVCMNVRVILSIICGQGYRKSYKRWNRSVYTAAVCPTSHLFDL